MTFNPAETFDDAGLVEVAAGRPPRDANQMGGLAKGLAVIEAFSNGRAMTIADIARASGLDRATARRCLLTLVGAGYASSDGRQFALTPRILRLGHSYLAASLPRLIHPSMQRLALATQESCSAAVLDGHEIVYVARVAHHRLIGVGLHPGSRLPAYCTVLGRVLLAALPPAESRALLEASERPAITDRTLTGIDELMDELARVRTDRYALIDGEVEPGSRSIGVPLLNVAGQTVAALNIGAKSASVTVEQLRQEFLPRLFETQAELREILS
jgi:IclR family pca regulon transcriptional regulator